MRVPKAGGTLFKVDDIIRGYASAHGSEIADSSLILLADILPTGAFAALQALQHPKLSPMLAGVSYPPSASAHVGSQFTGTTQLTNSDRTIIIAIVGLGPVGVVRHKFASQRSDVLRKTPVRCSEPP